MDLVLVFCVFCAGAASILLAFFLAGSKSDSGSMSKRDLQLPILIVSAAFLAACRCGTYEGNSAAAAAALGTFFLSFLVSFVVFWPTVSLTTMLFSSVVVAVSISSFLTCCCCCCCCCCCWGVRTTFSLPTPFISLSSFFSLVVTLVLLVLCRLSLAFLAAWRCGTIISVVVLAVTFTSLALDFLPRPRPVVVDVVDVVVEVMGEKALTAALVRTTEELLPSPPRRSQLNSLKNSSKN